LEEASRQILFLDTPAALSAVVSRRYSSKKLAPLLYYLQKLDNKKLELDMAQT
jgi:hypothetical protein